MQLMNGWMNEWMNEWENEWVNEWGNPCVLNAAGCSHAATRGPTVADDRAFVPFRCPLTRFRVLPLLPQPTAAGWAGWPLACYFYPRGAVSVSQPASREESRGAGVSHHTHLSLPSPLPPSISPSLSLFPKIAVSRDQLVLEREREREKEDCIIAWNQRRGYGLIQIVTPAKPTPAQAELMCCYFWEPRVSRGDLMTQWRQCGSIADWRNWVASIWVFCSISNRKDGNECKMEVYFLQNASKTEVNENAEVKMITVASRRPNPSSISDSKGGVYVWMLFFPSRPQRICGMMLVSG